MNEMVQNLQNPTPEKWKALMLQTNIIHELKSASTILPHQLITLHAILASFHPKPHSPTRRNLIEKSLKELNYSHLLEGKDIVKYCSRERSLIFEMLMYAMDCWYSNYKARSLAILEQLSNIPELSNDIEAIVHFAYVSRLYKEDRFKDVQKITSNSTNADVNFIRACSLFKLGVIDACIFTLHRNCVSDGKMLMLMAMCHFKKNDMETCFQCLEESLTHEMGRVGSINLIVYFLHSHEYLFALRCALLFHEKDPCEQSHYLLRKSYFFTEKWEKCKHEYDLVIQNDSADSLDVVLEYAFILSSLQNWSECVDICERVLSSFPEENEFSIYLIFSKFKLGDLSIARKYLQKKMKSNFQSLLVAFILIQSKEWDDAYRILHRLALTFENETWFMYHYSLATYYSASELNGLFHWLLFRKYDILNPSNRIPMNKQEPISYLNLKLPSVSDEDLQAWDNKLSSYLTSFLQQDPSFQETLKQILPSIMRASDHHMDCDALET